MEVLSNEEVIRVMSSMLSRLSSSGRLGLSFDGARDIYTALGLSKDLLIGDFFGMYDRHPVAKRLVNAPADATWRGIPRVLEAENAEETTDFEKEWKNLTSRLRLWAYLNRVDRLAGIGNYSVLLLGFAGGSSFSTPLKKGKALVYVMPYSQRSVTIKKINTDRTSPRFGLPELYEITTELSIPGLSTPVQNKSIDVHWTRIIHVAENLLENDLLGEPRMKSTYNYLYFLEMVAGGSAEMFWRTGFPGYGLNANPEFDFTQQTKAEINQELQGFIHGMTRYLKLQGVDVKQFSPNVADPSGVVSVLMDMISAGSGIPKRILTGSERGQLASDQDKQNWADRIDERRKNFADPVILRPLIDRLIEYSVLPMPRGGPLSYEIEWPDAYSLSEKDQAVVAKTKSDAFAAYCNSPRAMAILPPDAYLVDVLGVSKQRAVEIAAAAKAFRGSELEEIQKITEPKVEKPAPANAGNPSGKRVEDKE